MNPFEISRTGLDVEWQRLQVIAQNLANMNTTRTVSGQPYQPIRLLSGPKESFGAHLKGHAAASLDGVTVIGVEAIPGAARRVYDPTHPHADADGFVSYPAVDQAQEMALMVKTARVYEADLTAMSMAAQMFSKALELGR